MEAEARQISMSLRPSCGGGDRDGGRDQGQVKLWNFMGCVRLPLVNPKGLGDPFLLIFLSSSWLPTRTFALALIHMLPSHGPEGL